MDKCPNCGNKLSNLDVLCPKCGALVEVVQNKNNIYADSGDSSKAINPQKSEPLPYPVVKEPDSPAETISDKFSDFSFIPNDSHEKAMDNSETIFNFDSIKKIGIDKNNIDNIKTNDNDEQSLKEDTPAGLPSQNKAGDEADSYLQSIKNMPLPELDNLDDFDPEEFIRQYRQKNKKPASDEIKQESIEKEETENKSDRNSLWFDEASNQNKETQSSLDDKETPSSLDKKETPSSLDNKEAQSSPEDKQPSFIAQETQKKDDKESKKKIKREKKEKQKIAKAVKTIDKNKTPRVVGRIPVFLTVIIWLLAAGALFGGFFFLDSYVKTTFGGYGAFIYEITDGKIDLDVSGMTLKNNLQVSFTQTQDENGANAHLFEVTARNGVSVNVLPLNETYELKEGYAQIIIPDSELARSLNIITFENQYITNDIFLEVASKKSSYKYNIESLELFLVKAEYSRQEPIGSVVTTFENFFNVDILVSPGVKVYINEKDYSSYVDEKGVLNTNIFLEKIGTTTFNIDIIQPGKAAVKDIFTVTRQEPRTTLVPDSNYIRVYNDAFECLGITDPDAAVTAKISPDNVFVGEINKQGRYSILCYVYTFGLHHAQLAATSKDKADTVAALTIEYVPEANSFIAGARECTIDEILIENKALKDIPLSVKGNMKNILAEDEAQNFMLYSQDDELNCYYYGPLQLSQDREYTIYGIYDTDTLGFYAMYIS